MIHPQDPRKNRALGFNNIGDEILEIREEDTVPAPPNDQLRKRLEERYGRPKNPPDALTDSDTK